MLFNSIHFLFFFPIVYILYWFLGTEKKNSQNVLLLIASYVFYCFWDYRFGFLLAFSTLLCYYTGLKIFTSKKSKAWLILGVVLNLTFLGLFKYFNFFIQSFSDFLSLLGFEAHIHTLYIILPVGISFYTFHGLSYIIDIYQKKIEPTKNIVDYSLFVSFFPLLVAGPIERASHLLPQIQKKRRFNYDSSIDGLRQILWGFFKKMVIADNCAIFVNNTFAGYENLPAGALIISAVLFTIQIYCDFSGYSDIALGVARLLGFNLLKNFNFPYFSRDIAEFWRRWHISLTTWFRDYIYIPLGGSRTSKSKVIRNTFIIFLISGLWHGANWTFIAWGFLHACFFLPLLIIGKNRKNLGVAAEGKVLPSLKEFSNILATFIIVTIAWILFRASNIEEAISYFSQIFSTNISDYFYYDQSFKILFLPILVLFTVEWFQRDKEHGLNNIKLPIYLRLALYYYLIFSIVFVSKTTQTFIYFQF